MTRRVLHTMPIRTTDTLIASLEAGWTVFKHRDHWWASTTNPITGTRLMARVSDWQVASAIRSYSATQSGIRLLPTFSPMHRRYAA